MKPWQKLSPKQTLISRHWTRTTHCRAWRRQRTCAAGVPVADSFCTCGHIGTKPMVFLPPFGSVPVRAERSKLSQWRRKFGCKPTHHQPNPPCGSVNRQLHQRHAATRFCRLSFGGLKTRQRFQHALAVPRSGEGRSVKTAWACRILACGGLRRWLLCPSPALLRYKTCLTAQPRPQPTTGFANLPKTNRAKIGSESVV
jgi:hypothetical protein